MLNVCLPGTGGMLPLENRWLTCCWMEYQGKSLLIDCGEGTQIALKKCGCRLSHLDLLLITHFHADHIAGLPGLLLSIGNSGKTTPLMIAGPEGLEQVISALTVIAPVLPFPLSLHVLKENSTEDFKVNGMRISHFPLSHGIPCLGYRITVERKPVFNPEKANALGIAKTLFKYLHEGNTVQLEDGRVITPEQVLDGPRPPIRVGYCTDTLPVDAITALANNADLFIGEGMYGDEGMRGKMKEKGHMLFSDSARIAKKSGAKRLWLTHYSPALTNPEPYMDEVRKIFPQTVAAYDGIRINLGEKTIPETE